MYCTCTYILYTPVSSIIGFESNFDKVDTRIATTNGITYDYDSLMHYRANAFSRNGRNTIVPVNNNVLISRLGNRDGFSSRDVDHVNALYRCPGTCESACSVNIGIVCVCRKYP